MTIKELIENKATLNYQQICTTLIQTFRVEGKVNWESVLPAQQQQEYFGGETLRLIAEHPILSKQKDIRPIALKKGSISQMLFFYVCLQDPALPKKEIQDVTKKFISGGDANRYITWFFGNKESTQMKVVLSAKEGKKIVLKTLPFGIKQPYYKTYTYILEKINEEVNQLFVEPTDLWKALWKAFDISVINTKFYNEIRDAFNDLGKQLNKKGTPFKDETDRVQFSIRLIGRIIFCWFLKRKEVLHEAAISSEAVKAHAQKNYYHDLLEPLFFDVLNTPDKERRAGLPKLIAHYPFLNGGLFEAQETDYKQHLLLNIDNDWFFNLFAKTLERYNFTVDENSSSNAEIAIDPEMLGRIFENLLAEQNPETGESARKATGSFYTPREIVDYMVEQSITEFLKTSLENHTEQQIEIKENLFGVVPNQQLSLPKVVKLMLHTNWQQDVEDFVHTQILPNGLAKHEEIISTQLNKIKVLDPACGSGAFPIGILQKIVALKQQLHPKVKNYKLKLDAIQNSIYGVDIQPMAVELSRLRCWLSLVVDEDPKDIKALPNLDFKFVCADSLMEVGKIKQINIGNSAEKIEELKELRTEFFITTGKRKRELEKKFKQIQTSLNNNFLEWDGKSKLVENLASWKPFDNHKTEWFDAFWMFGLNDGFDVVIGNPPYIDIKRLPKEKVKLYFSIFKTTENRINLYSIFIERGVSLLNQKGVLVYINPNSILINESYKKVRKHIVDGVEKIVKLPDSVFEAATVETIILVSKKKSDSKNVLGVYFANNDTIDFSNLTFNSFSRDEWKEDEDSRFNIFSNAKVTGILKKIFINSNPLENYIATSLGITPYDKYKGHSEELIKNREFHSRTKLSKEYVPLISGKSIHPFYISNEFDEYLKYGDWLGAPRDKKFFENPKIIVRQILAGNELKIVAGYSERKIYFTQIGFSLISKDGDSDKLKLILCLLNSSLINYYHKNKFLDKEKIIFQKILIANCKQLPVKVPTNLIAFVTLVDFILVTKENQNSIHQSVSSNLIAKQLEDIIDGMVLELYFPEVMKDTKVDIIELVEDELKKAKSNDITESIYNFYKSVSHPDSEIRNRILLFAIVSPDILKPILQGQ